MSYAQNAFNLNAVRLIYRTERQGVKDLNYLFYTKNFENLPAASIFSRKVFFFFFFKWGGDATE